MKTTRLCSRLLRSPSLSILRPASSVIATPAVPLFSKCRYYSTGAKKPAIPKEAMDFLETLRDQYKPHEDKISMDQAQANMNNWSKEGEDFLSEGKTDRALKCFNRVIEVELPEGYGKTVEMREYTARSYLGRAFINTQNDNFKEALDDYKHLLENFDDDPDTAANAHHDRAVVHFQLTDSEAALADINKCLELPLRKTSFVQHNLIDAYKLRAHIYADLKMQTEAIADANFALSKKKDISNYMFRSNIYLEFGNLEDAKKDLDTADEMGADDASFWFAKSLVYVQLPGGVEEATKALKKAFRRDPALEREVDGFPALKPIFENIMKTRGMHLAPPSFSQDS